MPAPKRGSAPHDPDPKMRKLDEDEEALSSKTAPATNTMKTGNNQENTAAPRTKIKRSSSAEGGNKPARATKQSSPVKEAGKDASDPPVKKAKLLKATSASYGEAPPQRANSNISLKRTASTESDDDFSSDGSKVDFFRERDDEDKARCIRKYSNKVKAKRRAEESPSDPQEATQASPPAPVDPVQMDHNYGRFSDSSCPQTTDADDNKESDASFTRGERSDVSEETTAVGGGVKNEAEAEETKGPQLKDPERGKPVDDEAPSSPVDCCSVEIPLRSEDNGNGGIEKTGSLKSQQDVENETPALLYAADEVNSTVEIVDRHSGGNTASSCESESRTELVSEENKLTPKCKTQEGECDTQGGAKVPGPNGDVQPHETLSSERIAAPEQLLSGNTNPEGQTKENPTTEESSGISEPHTHLKANTGLKEELNTVVTQLDNVNQTAGNPEGGRDGLPDGLVDEWRREECQLSDGTAAQAVEPGGDSTDLNVSEDAIVRIETDTKATNPDVTVETPSRDAGTPGSTPCPDLCHNHVWKTEIKEAAHLECKGGAESLSKIQTQTVVTHPKPVVQTQEIQRVSEPTTALLAEVCHQRRDLETVESTFGSETEVQAHVHVRESPASEPSRDVSVTKGPEGSGHLTYPNSAQSQTEADTPGEASPAEVCPTTQRLENSDQTNRVVSEPITVPNDEVQKGLQTANCIKSQETGCFVAAESPTGGSVKSTCTAEDATPLSQGDSEPTADTTDRGIQEPETVNCQRNEDSVSKTWAPAPAPGSDSLMDNRVNAESSAESHQGLEVESVKILEKFEWELVSVTATRNRMEAGGEVVTPPSLVDVIPGQRELAVQGPDYSADPVSVVEIQGGKREDPNRCETDDVSACSPRVRSDSEIQVEMQITPEPEVSKATSPEEMQSRIDVQQVTSEQAPTTITVETQDQKTQSVPQKAETPSEAANEIKKPKPEISIPSPPAETLSQKCLNFTAPGSDTSEKTEENLEYDRNGNRAHGEGVVTTEGPDENKAQTAEEREEVCRSEGTGAHEVSELTTDTGAEKTSFHTSSEQSSGCVDPSGHLAGLQTSATPGRISDPRPESDIQHQQRQEPDGNKEEAAPEGVPDNTGTPEENSHLAEHQNHAVHETGEHAVSPSDQIQTPPPPIAHLESKEKVRLIEPAIEDVRGNTDAPMESLDCALEVEMGGQVMNQFKAEEGPANSEVIVFLCDRADATGLVFQPPEEQVEVVSRSDSGQRESQVVYEPISSPESDAGAELHAAELHAAEPLPESMETQPVEGGESCPPGLEEEEEEKALEESGEQDERAAHSAGEPPEDANAAPADPRDGGVRLAGGWTLDAAQERERNGFPEPVGAAEMLVREDVGSQAAADATTMAVDATVATDATMAVDDVVAVNAITAVDATATVDAITAADATAAVDAITAADATVAVDDVVAVNAITAVDANTDSTVAVDTVASVDATVAVDTITVADASSTVDATADATVAVDAISAVDAVAALDATMAGDAVAAVDTTAEATVAADVTATADATATVDAMTAEDAVATVDATVAEDATMAVDAITVADTTATVDATADTIVAVDTITSADATVAADATATVDAIKAVDAITAADAIATVDATMAVDTVASVGAIVAVDATMAADTTATVDAIVAGDATMAAEAAVEVETTAGVSEEFVILEPVPESEIHVDILTQAAAESGLSASLSEEAGPRSGPAEELGDRRRTGSAREAADADGVKDATQTVADEAVEQEAKTHQDGEIPDPADAHTANSHVLEDGEAASGEKEGDGVDLREVQILEDMEIGREIVVAEENEEDGEVTIVEKPPDPPSKGLTKKSEEKANEKSGDVRPDRAGEKVENKAPEAEKPKKQEMNTQARTKARLAALAEQKAAASKRAAQRQQLNLLALCQEIAEDIATDSMLLKRIEEEKQAAAAVAAAAAKAEACRKERPAANATDADPVGVPSPAGPEAGSQASAGPAPEVPAAQTPEVPAPPNPAEAPPPAPAEPQKRRFFVSQISVPLKAHEKKKLTRYQRLRQVELQREKMSWARVKKLKSDQASQMFAAVDWQAPFSAGSLFSPSPKTPPPAASPLKTPPQSPSTAAKPTQPQAEDLKVEAPKAEPVSKTEPAKSESVPAETAKAAPVKAEMTKAEPPPSETRRSTRQSKAQASKPPAVAAAPPPQSHPLRRQEVPPGRPAPHAQRGQRPEAEAGSGVQALPAPPQVLRRRL